MAKYFIIIFSALIILTAQGDDFIKKTKDVSTLCEMGYYLD